MDYEYDPEEEYAPRVLWGRVVIFLVALLAVFLLGRCTAAGGASEAELAAERNRVLELSSENELLQQQLDAAQNGEGGEAEGGEATEEAGAGEAETEGGEGQDGVAEEGETYTVKSGDTLTKIAEQFYGDPRKFNLIAEANNIESGDLRVGQELTIPPDE